MAILVFSKKDSATTQVSPHFKVREFACQDGTDPVFIDQDLINLLEQIRTHFNAPITINSGYRNPSHNKKVGGATYSQHVYGKAADIVVKGIAPATVAAYVETLIPNSGGIGTYSSWVHVDTRAKKSRWKG